MEIAARKTLLRWTAGLAAVAVILPVVFAIAIHSGPGRRWVWAGVQDYARGAYDLDVQSTDFGYNLLRGRTEISALVIRSNARPDLPALFEADRVQVDFRFLELLRSTVWIESATLDGVRIAAHLESEGAGNLPSSGPPTVQPDTPSGFAFRLASLQIEGESFRFTHEGLELDVVLPEWQINLSEQGQGEGHTASLSVAGGGQLTRTASVLDVGPVALESVIGDDQVAVSALTVNSAIGSVVASGALNDFVEPELDLTLDLTLEGGPAARLAGLTVPVDGEIQTSARIFGPIGSPNVIGHTEAPRFVIDRFEALELGGDWTWDSPTNTISIAETTVAAPLGRFGLEGTLSLESDGPNSLRAEVLRIDLEQATTVFPTPVRLSGIGSGNVQGRWTGLDWQTFESSGRLDFRLDEPPQNDALGLSGTVLANGVGAEMSFETVELRAVGAEIDGTINVSTEGELDGDLDVVIIDLADTIGELRQLFGEGSDSSPVTYPQGSVSLTTGVSGTATAPVFHAAVEAPSLSYQPLTGLAVSADVSYRDAVVEIERSSVSWNGQTALIDGTIGWTPSPQIDIRAESDGLVVSSFLEGLGADVDFEGTADVRSVARGSFEDLQLDATVSLTEFEAYGYPLGDGDVALDFQGDDLRFRAQLERPATDIDPNRLIASGRYSIGANDFELEAEVDHSVPSGIKIGNSELSGGRLNLSLDANGAMDDPSLRFEAAMDDVAVGTLALGPIDLEGSIEEHRLRLTANLPRFGTAATGDVGIESPYPSHISINSENLDLRLLNSLTGNRNVTGALTARLDGAGDLASWRDSELNLDIDQLTASVDNYSFTTDGPARVRYWNHRVEIDPVGLTSEGRRLEISGSLPLELASPDAELRVEGVIDAGSLLALAPSAAVVQAAGQVSFEATIGGSFVAPRPRLEAGWTEGSVEIPNLPQPVTGIDARVTLEELSLIQMSATGLWSGTRFDARGQLPLELVSDTFRLAGEARLAELEAEVLDLPIELLPGVPPALEGRTDLRVVLEARSLVPDAVEGTVQVDRLNTRINELNFMQDRPTVISIGNGRARISNFSLVGPQTRLEGNGEIELSSGGAVRFDVEGQTDTLVLAAASGAAESTGRIRGELQLRGSVDAPRVSGTLYLQNADLRIASPEIEVQDLNAVVRLEPASLTLENLSGTLNGGSLEASGNMGYSGLTPGIVSLSLRFEDTALEIPDGFRWLSRGDVEIRSRGPLWVIGGRVEILEGIYTNPLQIEQFVLDAIGSGDDGLDTSAPMPLLNRVRYDLAIETLNPVIVDNDTTHVEATAQLRLMGSYENPGLTGRIAVAEGSQFTLRESDFVIERGLIDFANPNRLDPRFDVLAQTEAGDYDITLLITGGGGQRMTTTLTSDPPLDEPNIVSVLLTGRRLGDLHGAEVNVATEQALSYITGSLGGSLSRGAERALGLSEVRIEPTLIANESDPGARLTIGQDLSRNLELIYSMNLVDSSDQIWVAEYNLARQFVTRSIKQKDNTYRFDLRHDFQIGAPPNTGGVAPSIRTVRGVDVQPASFENRELLSLLDIKPGDRYLFFELRRGIDRLSNFFRDRDYLEARIRVQRETEGSRVDIGLTADVGPRVVFAFEGFQPDRGLRNLLRTTWSRSTIDTFRLGQSSLEIRKWFVARGFLQARLEGAISDAEGVKTIRFQADPGPSYRRRPIEFEGITAFDSEALSDEIRDARLSDALILEPERVQRFIVARYHTLGYLDARVRPLEYAFEPEQSRARVIVRVEEGPTYRFGQTSFAGNEHFDRDELERTVTLSGRIYRADSLRAAAANVEQLYWQAGFNDVVVERTPTARPDDGLVDVVFTITENARGEIRTIEIAGRNRVTEAFVRSQLDLQTGTLLNFEELNAARRRLYATGAFSRVDIEAVDTGGAPSDEGTKPVNVRLNVSEVAPYAIEYGAFFDTARGIGVISDFRNQNSLGSARVLGLRTRYDGELREVRAYVSQPSLEGLPIGTNLAGFFRREIESNFITDRRGVSIQQEMSIGNRFIFSYGYRFERAHTFERELDPLFPFDVTLKVAPVTATLTRDTRDDLLDASRGAFTSHALEYATGALGSDLKLIKYFGQFNRYLPLSAAAPVPFGGGLEKSRLVFASSTRLGLAAGLGGQEIVPSERFFAGGGTSMRGFTEDALGPANFFGDPEGGDAVLILNNELRFPMISIFDGVAFLDVGNVYSRISDFTLSDLRKTGGFGLRLRTPYFLLRADYGFKLDRRPHERRGTFFFSIGQAF